VNEMCRMPARVLMAMVAIASVAGCGERSPVMARPQLLSTDAAARSGALERVEQMESVESMPARFIVLETCIGRYADCLRTEPDALRID
jgi:predicted small lipoprotein YifL